MKFQKITIQNFFRIKNLTIDLSQPGLTLIEGINHDVGSSNEAGKSTIFEALCWCLFGRYSASVGRTGDEVINPTEGSDCKISLKLVDNQLSYHITRTRNYGPEGSSAVQVVNLNDQSYETWDLRKKNSAESTRVIEDIIGCDYDTFLRAYYFAQEGIEPFGRMTDRALKTFFIEKLLKLEWVEDAYERAKNDYSEYQQIMGRCESRIKSAESSLDGAKSNLKRYIIRYRDAKNTVAQSSQRITDELKVLSIDILELKIRKKDIKKKIDLLKKEIGQIQVTDYTGKIRSVSASIIKIETEIKGLQDKKINISNDYDSHIKLSKNHKTLVNERCEYCGNIIKKENLKDAKKFHETAAKTCKQAINDITESEKEKQKDLELLKVQLEKLEEKQDEAKSDIARKSELEKLVHEASHDYYNVKVSDKLSILKGKCLEYKRNKREPQNIFQQDIVPFIKLVKKAKEKINEEYNATVLSRKAAKVSGFWVDAFSPSGIQSFILNSIVSQLNSYISYYLTELSNGRIVAEFTTLKQLGSGEHRESISCSIRNIDGADTYVSLSGGAKRRVDLACSLGISDFKRATTSKSIKFLCLDETLSGVDSEWTEIFLKMIKKKFPDYSVFFITHQPIDRTLFDRVITVEKRNGETFINA